MNRFPAPTREDFPPGTRARLHTNEQGMQMASLGMRGACVHVNATPFLTGVILDGLPLYYHEEAAFRPDGWPLPEGVEPRGFVVSLYRLERWDGPETTCAIADEVGRPVTKSEFERLVNERK